jgi:hypothetical protein
MRETAQLRAYGTARALRQRARDRSIFHASPPRESGGARARLIHHKLAADGLLSIRSARPVAFWGRPHSNQNHIRWGTLLSNFRSFALTALALLAVVPCVAVAAPVLDQSNTSAYRGTVGIRHVDPFTFTIAQQTVTVGMTGELSRVELGLARRGTADLGAGTVSVSKLSAHETVTRLFSVAGLPEHPAYPVQASFVSFDLSADDFIVSAGDILQITVSHDAPGWLSKLAKIT